MNSPKVSVIMTVYNTDRYLRQSIESVLLQSSDDWELVIIDDGSTDCSRAICDEMAAKDERVTVVHKSNSGQADSRNIAIGMAKAEFVMFLDSDDWIEPYTIDFVLKRQRQDDADVVVFSYYEEYPNERIHIHNQLFGVFLRQETLDIYYKCKNMTTYMICGMLIKRALLNVPIPQLRYCEDTAVILQWVSQANTTVITDEPLYHYRMRKGSVMHIEKDAERTKANLQVIQIRNRFAAQHQLLPKQESDSYDAQAYLYVAQKFVRSCPSVRLRCDLAIMASGMLRELMPVDESQMKRKIRRRIHLLAEHPVRFAWQMYLTKFFSLKKKDQDHHNELFE